MKIADKALNYIKSITAQTITNAGSGHSGISLGASAIMLALFKDHYLFDVTDTDFLNRDRFVLSAGHAAPLYYTLLSLFGFDVSLQDLKKLRTLGSKTPGHPEYRVTDGVEASTGPLGQGIANAVGMALARRIMAEKFNTVGFPIIDHYTYALVGDGDLMEGIAQEACSFAGNLALDKLIILYDSNDVTMDGSLTISNKENVEKKFKAMGWNVVKCKEGNKFSACSKAIAKAKELKGPTIIIFKTIIGESSLKEGTSFTHGMIMNKEELKVFNQNLGVFENFYIPNEVRDWCMASARKGKLAHEKWNQDLAVYSNSNPELYRQFNHYFDKKKLDIEKLARSSYKWEGKSGRELNNIVLNEIGDKLQQMIGGSADVALSTKAYITNGGNHGLANKRGRNIRFGVREHAMAGICNGLALYEDFVPFCSSLLAFSNYMLPSIRMSAIMKLNVLYFFTHDSILIGKDGPSHQPVEQLASLRSIIGLKVFRPCDGNELLAGYNDYFEKGGPTAFVLSKQPMKVVDGNFTSALQGGYILMPAKKEAEIVLYASGSEVSLALSVAKSLEKQYDVSVVSFPCLEVFEEQALSYKAKVLQKKAKLRVAIEASNDNIWYKYLGDDGLKIGVEEYPQSGDGEEVYAQMGFTVKEIIKKINQKLA